jgi:hypothetical protein
MPFKSSMAPNLAPINPPKMAQHNAQKDATLHDIS